MKFIYFSALLLIFCKLNANAQNNFNPGYIVTLNGDTTKGFINQKELKYDPDQVTFKANTNAAAVNYSKETIKAFGIEGYGNYHTYTVQLKKNTAGIGVMVDYVDTSFVTKNVFLREIVTGKKASLFVYDDNIKQQYFVAESNSMPYELTGYVHYTFGPSMQAPTSMKLSETDTYKKQLQKLATLYQPGNTILTSKIEGAQYKQKDLREIIIAINGADVKYTEKRKTMRLFIGVGLNASGIRFTGEKHIYYPHGNVWSYLPQLNLGIEEVGIKNSKFVLRGELNISASKAEFTYNGELFPGTPAYTPYTYTNQITRVAIGLNPQLQYNLYNNTKVKVFIAGGIKVDLTVYPVNSSRHSLYDQDRIPVPTAPASTSLTAKGGVTLSNKLQLYGAYNSPIEIHRYNVNSAVVLTSYNFGINYFLGR